MEKNGVRSLQMNHNSHYDKETKVNIISIVLSTTVQVWWLAGNNKCKTMFVVLHYNKMKAVKDNLYMYIWRTV